MTLIPQVAPGVHMLQHSYVNCYLVEGDDGLTLVDAGLPGVWRELGHAIRDLGHRPSDLRGVVLTHAHFDHVGVIRRLRHLLDLPVWAHPRDAELAAHPYRYAHENPRAAYPLRHPRGIPILAAMAKSGALRVRGVPAHSITHMTSGSTLEIPGRPTVVFTPGHTYGHCALALPDRDVVLTGDALVTLDPYTGRTGPRIVAGAATADSRMALESLDVLAATGASTVLPGHGAAWRDGIASAVQQARAVGAA